MSFPRAKIHRFNDPSSCTPAPGSYDPKFSSKVKGAIIQKSERFNEQRISSACSDTTNASTGSCKSTTNCLPVFRTPQPPKKGSKSSQNKLNKKLFDSAEKKDGALDGLSQEEMYREVCVDRDNKDCTIKELEAQIEDMKGQQLTLQEECCQVRSLYSETVEKYAREEKEAAQREQKLAEKLTGQEKIIVILEERLKVQDDSVASLKQKLNESEQTIADLENKIHRREESTDLLKETVKERDLQIVELQKKNDCLATQVGTLKEDHDVAYAQHQAKVESLNKTVMEMSKLQTSFERDKDKLLADVKARDNRCEQLECEVKELQHQVGRKQQMICALQSDLDVNECSLKEVHSKYDSLQTKYQNEQSELCRKQNTELQDWAIQLDVAAKIPTIPLRNECLAAVLAEKSKLFTIVVDRLQLAQADCDSVQQQLAHQKLSHKSELAQITEKLEALDKERTALSEQLCVTERDLRTRMRLCDDLRMSNMENQVTVVELQDRIDELEAERNTIEKTLKQQLSDTADELEEKKIKCRKLEVGHGNMCATLEALKARLLESERDVERLTQENKQLCEQSGSFQGSLRQLYEEKHALEQELACLTEHNTNLQQAMERLEAETVEQIKQVQSSLLEKVEQFELMTQQSAESTQKAVSEKQQQIESLYGDLQSFRFKFSQVTEHVQHMEQEREKYLVVIRSLQEKEKEADTLLVLLYAQEEAQKQLNDQLTEQAMKLKNSEEQLSLCYGKISFLEAQVANLSNLLDQKSAQVAELQAKNLEMNTLCEELNIDHEQEIDALTEKLDHQRECAHIATQQISSLEERNRHIASQLETHKNMCSEMEEHARATEASNSELKLSLHAVKDNLSSLQSEMAVKENCLMEASERVCKLEAEKMALEVKVQEQAGVCLKLEETVANSKKQLEEKSQELHQQAREVDNLTTQLKTKDSILSDLQDRLQDAQNKTNNYKKRITDLEVLVQQNVPNKDIELERDELQRRCLELEALIGPFREQLELFKSERQELDSRLEAADNEVRDLGLKYAEILGHQNHKQKIRHVVNLKKQYIALKSENDKLQKQIHFQKKTIDELKQELGQTGRKKLSVAVTRGKENNGHSKSCPRPSTAVNAVKGKQNEDANSLPVSSVKGKPASDRSPKRTTIKPSLAASISQEKENVDSSPVPLSSKVHGKDSSPSFRPLALSPLCESQRSNQQ